MCGIAGSIDPSISIEERQAILKKMLATITHRGPDHSDQWTKQEVSLGHNRLSIIDLSEAANQPMHYQDCTMVFNGEVYNYVEIKKDLLELGYTFTTQSDSEVVMAAYKAWAERCVDRFVGMWAFAIWDDGKHSLFCSRDRFGIKPFYYIFENKRLYFASEIKALKTCPVFDSQLNKDQISRGIMLGWAGYGAETYYTSVQSLPAAHNLVMQNGKIRVEPYWALQQAGQDIPKSFTERAEQFGEHFRQSVQLHMRSDVPVGGCLSGGLDSSAIASAIGKLFPGTNFHTFTIFFSGSGEVDERPFANAVTDSYSNLHPHCSEPTDQDIEEAFENFFNIQDIPPAGSSFLSQYLVMQLAKKHGAKVLLDGQGSDEYLVGYMHSFYRIIGALLHNGNFSKAFQVFAQHIQNQGYTTAQSAGRLARSFLAALAPEQQLLQWEYRWQHPFLPTATHTPFQLEQGNFNRLNQFLYQLLFTTSLPTLLHYEDRNSMAFSIESRVPFLDHRLVEYAFALPDADKVHKGITKFILRKALEKDLPAKVAQRLDKKGFVTPGEVKWLRGPLRFLIEDFKTSRLDMLRTQKVDKLFSSYKNGDNRHALLVWRLACLGRWLE